MAVTSLESTLVRPLATVDSKALRQKLSPLDATLTKNGGAAVVNDNL